MLQENLAAHPQALGALATTAGLLIFCGAMGKSAQFPLHVWLPDAMEGPTPVSALIHAATMVAAGVYMLCRVSFLLNAPALEVIAWIGGFTALLSAVIAIQQNDIKRILAYSTLSQLGYMVMAVGLRGPASAMYHLTTHAFFKALLFLGAGSVILAMHHEQDIWKMGGLRKKMPVTFWTFVAGTLALSGLPPFSGFYSKDSILAQAAEHNPALLILGVAVAALTPFYMFRLLCVAFLGSPKSDAAGHAQGIAARHALAAAHPGHPQHHRRLHRHRTDLRQAIPGPACGTERFLSPGPDRSLRSRSGAGHFRAAGGARWPGRRLGALRARPRKTRSRPGWARSRAGCGTASTSMSFTRQRSFGCTICWRRSPRWFDRWIIAGLAVRGTHGTTELVGRALRLLQTGSLQTYAFLFAMGVALVLYLVLK